MYSADFIVIGSGIAGLNFALNAAKQGSVIILTKKELVESNTNYAQGGIAAVLNKHDSFAKHINDTLRTGDGLCDEQAVNVLVKYGPKMIKSLLNYGVGFNRDSGELALAQEGGHSERRIVHVKDATGKEVERILAAHIRKNKNIKVFEETVALELIKHKNKCLGVQAHIVDENKLKLFFGKRIILATGGSGQIYQYTSNPKIATGDGLAIAFRVGADLIDLEFVQFHPTALNLKNKPHYLISETVRGEGGILLNAKKEQFMSNYHAEKELAPRDIVSRAIVKEARQGPVYLDVRHLGKKFLKARFPTIYEQLWWYGLKIEKDLIPIYPVAHYQCGGIKTDTFGRTSILNLYAFGEVAGTGVHGANRLASNSLLESLVFSIRAYEDSVKNIKQAKIPSYEIIGKKEILKNISKKEKKYITNLQSRLKHKMWELVGIERDRKNLEKAQISFKKMLYNYRKRFRNRKHNTIYQTQNMLELAVCISKAALLREESRGTHFRLDFPVKNDQEWQKNIIINKEHVSFKDL